MKHNETQRTKTKSFLYSSQHSPVVHSKHSIKTCNDKQISSTNEHNPQMLNLG